MAEDLRVGQPSAELLQAIEAYTNHVCSLRIHGHHVLEGTSYRVIPGAAPVVNGQVMKSGMNDSAGLAIAIALEEKVKQLLEQQAGYRSNVSPS